MTLGAWFKEYVYYPVSVSKLLRRLTKAARRFGDGFARRIPVYIATMAVWAVTGMWHGNSWNFLVWGLMNGAILLISEELTEVLGMSDRILILKDGQVTRELYRDPGLTEHDVVEYLI